MTQFKVTDQFCEKMQSAFPDDPSRAKRTHELIAPDGRVKRFTFLPGQELEVERWAAMKFADIDAFVVTDEAGTRYQSRKDGKQPVRELAVDETIARYEELTQQALQARCQSTEGGEKFNKASGKGDMIAFLTSKGVVAVGGAIEPVGADDVELEMEEAA